MDQNLNFQPDSEPKYHFLKKKGFGLLIVSFLLVRILIVLLIPNKHYTLASDLTANNILNAVNKERSQRNLTTLNPNSKLEVAAVSKADDMIAKKYFAHVDPDGHYIWDKIVAAGYAPYAQLGENLAIEFYDVDSLMAAWMNSPTHRANILQEGFRDQGMGLSFGNVSDGQYYSSIANTFGTLAISKPTTQPVVEKPTTTPIPKTTTAKTPIAPIPDPSPVKKPTPTPVPSKPKPIQTIPTIIPITPLATTAPENSAPISTSQTTDPTPTSIINPVLVRGDDEPNNLNENNFTLPTENKTATETQPLPLPNAKPTPYDSASAVVGTKDTSQITNYEINRYLILIAGVFLLLLLGTDIKSAIEKKFGSLDKKVNNLALLFIALVVVAFIYWL
jgi:hypothetical protein